MKNSNDFTQCGKESCLSLDYPKVSFVVRIQSWPTFKDNSVSNLSDYT